MNVDKMSWQKLLSLKKYGYNKPRLRKDENPIRIAFEEDYDRIIFSHPFRSLQDKTQIIPLSKTDFVHTRLTHSLEVSAVGRSLGKLTGDFVLNKYPYLKELGYTVNDFGTIVAAACLCHDIGNPPFGHSGEKAIGDFFKVGKGEKYRLDLTDKEYQDLICFEGNANGFNILTASRPGSEGGLRISYATLGAFMKYPKESLPHKPTNAISDKKYGFFQVDKNHFSDIATELGLLRKEPDNIRFHRHPLAYMVEAADDICYTIIDFEDGINLGWIQEEYALEFLSKIVRNNIKRERYFELQTKRERIAYLRALAIGSLISDVVEVFKKNEEAILCGNFHHSLTDKCSFVAQMKDIIDISSSNIYRSSEVVKKEVIGYQVINTILEKFTSAVNNQYEGNTSHFDDIILQLLPEEYATKSDSLYERLLSVCSFVSLLTDGKALELYKLIANG